MAGGSKGAMWIGRALSAIVVLVLAADAAVSLFAPQINAKVMAEGGWPMSTALPLGVVMAVCCLAYAIPRTAVFGAILATAFFGGAISAHVRIGETASPPPIFCAVMIVLVWGGLYLRDARLRALLPLTT